MSETPRSARGAWVLVALAIWAIGATFWAATLQAQLSRMQREIKEEKLRTLVQALNGLYRPVDNGTRFPITVFDAWIPMARTRELASGGLEYTWETKSPIGGPTFLHVESDREQRVTKINMVTPEW